MADVKVAWARATARESRITAPTWVSDSGSVALETDVIERAEANRLLTLTNGSRIPRVRAGKSTTRA
jgi:hypothetical protein